MDEVKLVRTPQLIFEADDLNTLQQMINNFGKAELSFDPKAVRPLTASDHPKLQPEVNVIQFYVKLFVLGFCSKQCVLTALLVFFN